MSETTLFRGREVPSILLLTHGFSAEVVSSAHLTGLARNVAAAATASESVNSLGLGSGEVGFPSLPQQPSNPQFYHSASSRYQFLTGSSHRCIGTCASPRPRRTPRFRTRRRRSVPPGFRQALNIRPFPTLWSPPPRILCLHQPSDRALATAGRAVQYEHAAAGGLECPDR